MPHTEPSIDPAATTSEDAVAMLMEMGEAIEDVAEETFMLFSQELPSNDLGILDDKAAEVNIDINGREYCIIQSSGLLRSFRAAGTTGAMLWKVTPRIAKWLASHNSSFWQKGILSQSAHVLELGCGVAGLVGMALSPLVSTYTLTDQTYVLKYLKENIIKNQKQHGSGPRSIKERRVDKTTDFDNLHIIPLDWEHDSVQNLGELLPFEPSFDLVLICDCVYNSFLIDPLTQICVDICELNPTGSTVVLVAQQLRTSDVFEEWLSRFIKDFRIWRVKDEFLPENLKSASGYVVHMALLRGNDRSR